METMQASGEIRSQLLARLSDLHSAIACLTDDLPPQDASPDFAPSRARAAKRQLDTIIVDLTTAREDVWRWAATTPLTERASRYDAGARALLQLCRKLLADLEEGLRYGNAEQSLTSAWSLIQPAYMVRDELFTLLNLQDEPAEIAA
jgi:hypothetical protein